MDCYCLTILLIFYQIIKTYYSYNLLEQKMVSMDFYICLGFSSHSKIVHSYGNVNIGGERLQILTFGRHPWSLNTEGSLACHTYCDTGHPFIMIISEDPWHSHLLPSNIDIATLYNCHVPVRKVDFEEVPYRYIATIGCADVDQLIDWLSGVIRFIGNIPAIYRRLRLIRTDRFWKNETSLLALSCLLNFEGWVFESQPRHSQKQVVTAPLLNARQ